MTTNFHGSNEGARIEEGEGEEQMESNQIRVPSPVGSGKAHKEEKKGNEEKEDQVGDMRYAASTSDISTLPGNSRLRSESEGTCPYFSSDVERRPV